MRFNRCQDLNCICNLVPSRTGIKFESTPEPYPDKQNPPHYCSLKDTPREVGTLNDFNPKVQIKKWIKDGGNINSASLQVLCDLFLLDNKVATKFVLELQLMDIEKEK